MLHVYCVEQSEFEKKKTTSRRSFQRSPSGESKLSVKKKKKKRLCAELWEGGYFSVRLTPSVMYGALT